MLTAALVAVLSVAWVAPGPAAAGELEKVGTSLQWIPADAAFYCSMLRNREQIEIVAKSKAWQSLMEMPAVQDGLRLLEAQGTNLDSPAGMAQAQLKNPQVQKILAVLADMFSDEIFMYGNEDLIDALELFQTLNNTMSYGPMLLEASGESSGMSRDEQVTRLMLDALAKNLGLLKVPSGIMGFHVDNPDEAKKQLDMVAGILTIASLSVPELEGFFDRTKVGDHEYLTIKFNGQMIPWDQLPMEKIKEAETNAGDAEKVVAKIKELKLVIALGLRDDYLLFAIVDSTDRLAELGTGELLIDRPEFKPLEKFAEAKLVAIEYVSEEFTSRLALGDDDIDDLLEWGEMILPQANLGDEMEEQVRKDAQALAADIKAALPKPGAAMGFSFMTPQGVEGYRYNFSDPYGLDGSKPLSLLNHVGGDPLLAIVGRGHTSIKDYDVMVRWLKTAHRYVEQFALGRLSDRERQQYDKALKLVKPLLARVNKANRELLIPAFADGQSALVLDAKLAAKQFCREMPPTDEPMPMIEPALVMGVSNAELVRQAYVEYQSIFDELVDVVREVEPGSIPDGYRIPWPDIDETDEGTVAFYTLPKKWGVDEQIVPNAGLSDSVVAVTGSRAHTKRLLTATPLKVGGVLAETDRPLAVAVAFNWAGLVDAAGPWVEFAARQILNEQLPIDDATAKQAEIDTILEQVQTVLAALKTMRAITAETYVEDEQLVTHTLVEIRDIE
jgi:hypothetical protein